MATFEELLAAARALNNKPSDPNSAPVSANPYRSGTNAYGETRGEAATRLAAARSGNTTTSQTEANIAGSNQVLLNDTQQKKLNELKAAFENAKGKEERDKIRAQIRTLDADEVEYSFWERLGNTLKGGAKDIGSSYLNTASYITRLGNEANAALSDEDRAINNSAYSGWVTDPLTEQAFRDAYREGTLDNAGILEENIRNAQILDAKSRQLSESAAQDIETAKENASGIGKFLIDTGVAGVGLAADQAMNLLAPGLGTVNMAIRTFGDATEQARQDGAGMLGQGLYGGARAALSVGIEKAFGGALNKIYGKGFADEVVEAAIGKLAKSDLGRSIWRLIFDGGGEGVEELVEAATEPITQLIYNRDALNENWGTPELAKEAFASYVYEGLVGAALGGLGFVGNVVTGENARANAKLRNTQDAAAAQNAKNNERAGVQAETSQEAAGATQTQGDESIPPAQQAAPQMPSDELNSGSTAEATNRLLANISEAFPDAYAPTTSNAPVERAAPAAPSGVDVIAGLALENQAKSAPQVVTKPAADANMTTEAQVPTTIATQEGAQNGKEQTGYTGDNAGRQAANSSYRPEQPRERGVAGRDTDEGHQRESSVVLSEELPGPYQTGRRVNKAHNAIAKRSSEAAAKYNRTVAKDIGDTVAGSHIVYDAIERGATDEEIFASLVELATDKLVEKALRSEKGRGELIYAIMETGVDEKTATEIADEILADEKATDEEDLPFYVGEDSAPVQEKPKQKPQILDTRKKADIRYTENESGKVVANITNANTKLTKDGKSTGVKQALFRGDTQTVKFAATKYKPHANDRVMARNRETGAYVVQRGYADRYYVVSEDGMVIGEEFSDFGKAKAKLFGKMNVYAVASVPLADGNLVYLDETRGEMRLDTNAAFSNQKYHVNQGQSQASDDLGVEYSSYTESALNTDIIMLDLSTVLDSDRYTSNREYRRALDFIDTLLVGKKEKGQFTQLPGIVGHNGKRYVFAGQTSNQRKKNVIMLMEESKYAEVRKNMVAGLSDAEIETLNPAKWFTNRGTYFTPSNADTGIKLRDAIVVPDYQHMMFGITREFLRTTNDGKDKQALIDAGYSPDAAEEIIKKNKVGAKIIIHGDLLKNVTDGTGFIVSDKGESFQARGPGGFKGLFQAFDVFSHLKENIPYDEHAQYVWKSPSGEKVGGIRFVSKEKGIEMLNSWGEWEPIAGKKAIIFESMFKFAPFYRDGADFRAKAGDYDIRSIPKENVYGARSDSGMVAGYKRQGMGQTLRTQTALSKEDLEAVVYKHVIEPIDRIMADPKKQAKLFGVDFDSKTPPVGTDNKANIIWYLGEDFMSTPLAQKWVARKLKQIIEDFKGGKIYFEEGSASYQWVAPDPVGLLHAMTSMQFQSDEIKAKDNAKRATKKAEGITHKGYTGLARGEIANQVLAEGTTLVTRNPAMEERDAQLRKNTREALFDDFIEKYGLDPNITYIAINDTLELNLDNDFDGDTVLATQGAIAEGIKRNRERLFKDGADKHFTEISHGKAGDEYIHNAEVIAAAIRAGLDAESVGKYDMYIDYINSFPVNKALRKRAAANNMTPREYKAKLTQEFAAAYKLTVDYAKTQYFDAEFRATVDDFMDEFNKMAEESGYYVGKVDGKKFTPVPESWQYSKNAKKKARYEEARRLNRTDKVEGKRTILRSDDTILGQLVEAKINSQYGRNISLDEHYGKLFKAMQNGGEVDLSTIGTIASKAYFNVPSKFMGTVAKTYDRIMSKSVGAEDGFREAKLKEMYSALGLDGDQFSSLLLNSLAAKSERTNYDTLLSFDQDDGTTPVSKILARNMRILGNIATIRTGLADTEAKMEQISKSVAEQRAKLAEAKAALAADEVMLRRELDSAISDIEALANQTEESLTEIREKIEKYSARKENAKTLASYLSSNKTFEKFSKKAELLEAKLDALNSELEATRAISDDNADSLLDIAKTLRETFAEEIEAIEAMETRLSELQREYEGFIRRNENEQAKQEYYGVGLALDTGLENADFDALAAKLDKIAPSTEQPAATEKAPAAEPRTSRKEAKQVPLKKTPEPTAQNPAKKTSESQPVPPRQEAVEPASPKQEEAKAPEEQAKEPVSPRVTYGDRYSLVRDAVRSIAAGVGEGAKVAIPDSVKGALNDGVDIEDIRKELYSFAEEVTNAFAAPDDGASLRALAASFDKRVENSKLLYTLVGDPKTSNVAKAARAIAEADDAFKFENAAADFSETLAAEIRDLPKRMKTIKAWRGNVNSRNWFSKLMSSDSAVGSFGSAYFGYQKDFMNILQGLDGFDKFADGDGYRFADDIMASAYKASKIMGDAVHLFMTAQADFEKSGDAKKKVDFSFVRNHEVESYTISMAEAVDLLHLFQTLQSSKVNAWKNVRYNIGDQSMTMSSLEQFTSVKEALKKAVEGSEAAKAYYDAMSEGYAMYGKPTQKAIKRASGRSVELYSFGNYYPLGKVRFGKGEANARDFDFGLDSTGFTRRRTSVEGGIITVMDPAVRFDAYVNKATNLLSRAEVGAKAERLDRGGIIPSMSDIVKDRYGKGHVDVVKQFIKDANNYNGEADAASNWLKSLRVNIQGGAMGLNIGSMLVQPSSIFNAVGVLDMDSLTYGTFAMFKSDNRARAGELGAIRNRLQGRIDPTISETLNSDSRFKKAVEKIKLLDYVKKGYAIADTAAVKAIYLASEYQVRVKDGVSESDPTFHDKVEAYFVPAFMQSQAQYEKTLRSYVQTSESEGLKMLGMFKTQQLRNFNTMVKTIAETMTAKEKYGVGSKEYSLAQKTLVSTMSGQVTSAAFFGALRVLANLLYHRRKSLEDEEGKLDAGKMLGVLLINSAEAFAGTVLFGDAVAQMIIDKLPGDKSKRFYGVNAGTISTLFDTVEDFNSLLSSPSISKARTFAGDIAILFGIPLNNAYYLLNSMMMYGFDALGINDGNYDDVMKFLDGQIKDAKKANENAVDMLANIGITNSGNISKEFGVSANDLAEANNQIKELKADKTSEYSTAGDHAIVDIILGLPITDTGADAMVAENTGKSYQSSYVVLRALGYDPKEVASLYKEIDASGNGSLTQQEMLDAYEENPGMAYILEQLWNSKGYSKSWDEVT